MTREEAIERLNSIKGVFCVDTESAIDMAIEALSADADGEDLIIKGAKGIQDGIYNIKDGELFEYKAKGGTVRTYPIIPSADAVKRVDCSNFLLWLLEEIMDEDNWELNAVADGEIIARKLKKLGLLEVKDGYYHRIFDENVWVVRCKDCYHAEDDITHMYCVYFGHKVYDDDYCSNAVERKEKSEVEE